MNSNNECKNIKSFVKNHWYYDAEIKIYKEKSGFIGVTGRKFSCIRGSSKKRIIKLFGQPSFETDGKLIYYEGEYCFTDNNNCPKVEFVFRQKKLVEVHLIPMTFPSH